MKRFSFRLQKILDLALRREKLARREVARSLADLRAVEEDERRASEDVGEARRRVREIYSGGALDPGGLELLHRALLATEQRLADCRRDRRIAEEIFEKVRAAMEARRREALVLERARESAHDRWSEEAKRAENAELDGVASVRHTMKTPPEEVS